jgi:hypothetical protein
VNLNDYPTPRTDAARAKPLNLGDAVAGTDMEQVEREAAAWRAVAEELANSILVARRPSQALEAFDALKAKLEKP